MSNPNGIDAAEWTSLVFHIARKLRCGADVPWLDSVNVVAAGMCALVKSANDWRDDRGTQFKSFAYECVRHAMIRALREEYNWRAVRSRASQGNNKKRLVLFSEIGKDFVSGSSNCFASLDSSVPELERAEEVRAILGESLNGMDKRSKLIVQMRLGIDGCDKTTLEEVGRKLQITKERVRQIEARAMLKIRRWLKFNSDWDRLNSIAIECGLAPLEK